MMSRAEGSCAVRMPCWLSRNHDLGHGQVALFQPDSRAVVIGHAHILEDQPGNFGTAPAQHQCGLAFAGYAIEHGGTGLGGEIGNRARTLHRALFVPAGSNGDGALPVTNGVHRVLQVGKALPGLDHRIGRTAILREQRGGGDGGSGQSGDGEDHLAGKARCGRAESLGHHPRRHRAKGLTGGQDLSLSRGGRPRRGPLLTGTSIPRRLQRLAQQHFQLRIHRAQILRREALHRIVERRIEAQGKCLFGGFLRWLRHHGLLVKRACVDHRVHFPLAAQHHHQVGDHRRAGARRRGARCRPPRACRAPSAPSSPRPAPAWSARRSPLRPAGGGAWPRRFRSA